MYRHIVFEVNFHRRHFVEHIHNFMVLVVLGVMILCAQNLYEFVNCVLLSADVVPAVEGQEILVNRPFDPVVMV